MFSPARLQLLNWCLIGGTVLLIMAMNGVGNLTQVASAKLPAWITDILTAVGITMLMLTCAAIVGARLRLPQVLLKP